MTTTLTTPSSNIVTFDRSSSNYLLPEEKTPSSLITTAMSNKSSIGRKRSTGERRSITVDDTTINDYNQLHFACVIESRGANTEVGISYFNPATSTCILKQFGDSSSFPKTLQSMTVHPSESIIICKETLRNSVTPSKLYLTLEEAFPESQFQTMARREFEQQNGIKIIKQYCIEALVEPLLAGLKNKSYCLATIGPLFEFIQNRYNYANSTIRFIVESCEESVFIGNI